MRSPDHALFALINAGPGTARPAIDAALFLSDAMPAIVAGACLLGAALVPAWRRPLLAALLGLMAAWLAVTLLRSVVQVPRPGALGLGVQWASQGLRPGFPSMHASGSFAFAFGWLFVRWRGPAAGLLVFALAVGWSRVYLGLHFPSDVVAGALLGAITGGAAALALRKLNAG